MAGEHGDVRRNCYGRISGNRYVVGRYDTTPDTQQTSVSMLFWFCFKIRKESKHFLQGLEAYTESPVYSNVFGARVYKISRDPSGNRLTHMKITGGSLKVKEALFAEETNEEQKKEKVNQIRIYSGRKVRACAGSGSWHCLRSDWSRITRPGMTLGDEKAVSAPMLEPVLSYRVQYPREVDAHTMLGYLKQLEEEDPMLRIVWKEENGEIGVQSWARSRLRS